LSDFLTDDSRQGIEGYHASGGSLEALAEALDVIRSYAVTHRGGDLVVREIKTALADEEAEVTRFLKAANTLRARARTWSAEVRQPFLAHLDAIGRLLKRPPAPDPYPGHRASGRGTVGKPWKRDAALDLVPLVGAETAKALVARIDALVSADPACREMVDLFRSLK
jgi:hypothetical protein